MDNSYIKKIFTVAIIGGLLILSFLVLRPIVMDIILGLILAFIFYPVYKLFFKLTKKPNISASIITLFLLGIILVPIWFFTPMLIEQILKVYTSTQSMNFAEILKSIFPGIFSSEQFASEIGSTLNSFIPKIINSVLDSFSNFILNFPNFLLHSLVVLVTFYFALRDKDEIGMALKEVSPFAKDVDEKIAKYSREITSSVLYGQVILGFIEGLILAIGIVILRIPNALILSILSIIIGILPIIGPMVIWIPLAIYLVLTQNIDAAIILVIFGLIASNSDTFLRPLFVSKKAKIHSGIIFIGMIGGLFLFGVLGLLLGPLILAYMLILLEILQGKIGSKESIIQKGE